MKKNTDMYDLVTPVKDKINDMYSSASGNKCKRCLNKFRNKKNSIVCINCYRVMTGQAFYNAWVREGWEKSLNNFANIKRSMYKRDDT